MLYGRARGVSTVIAVLIVVVVVLAAVAAYGWLRPTAQATPAATTLEQQAYEEGKLVIYSTFDTSSLQTLVNAFVQQYPWAAGMIQFQAISGGTLTTQVISQVKAKSVQVDLVIDSVGHIMPLIEAEALQNWSDPLTSLMGYPNVSLVGYNQYWFPVFGNIVVILYNTQVLQKLNYSPPTSLQDLTNPKWKGLIALENPASLGTTGEYLADLYPILGASNWTALMEGIAANQPIITQSSRVAAQDVASGQAAVSIGILQQYLQARSQGLPVGVVFPSPHLYTVGGIAMVKYAPHQHFAELFIMWLQSAAGQMAIAKTGRSPAYPPLLAYTAPAGVLPQGVTFQPALLNQDFYTNSTSWSNLYTKIFGSS